MDDKKKKLKVRRIVRDMLVDEHDRGWRRVSPISQYRLNKDVDLIIKIIRGS